MKFGVGNFSFDQDIRKGTMTQFDIIAKSKEIGFEAVEFMNLTPPEGENVKVYAEQLNAEAKRCGIEIAAYTISADLAKQDNRSEIERLKREVDVAAALGVKLFRHDCMHNYNCFRSFDQALPVLSDAIREVTAYAETLGIKTMTENHGRVVQDSDRVERLVNAVNHPNYGVLIDMGNFMVADENPVTAVSRLANLAFLVHAKDNRWLSRDDDTEGYRETRGCNRYLSMPVGYGDVPVKQCVEILKRAGYDGYLDIEYGGGEDSTEALTKGLKYLKSL